MKKRLTINITVVSVLMLAFVLLSTNTSQSQDALGKKSERMGVLKRLWIGELWTDEQDIPSGGWEASYAWPGNHWRHSYEGENRLMNGCARQGGLGYGMKDWSDWRGNFYPYVVGGVHDSHMIHPPEGRFTGTGHEFKIVLRRPPPELIVDGKIQPPRQAYDEVDPSLICDGKIYVRWSMDIGLTCEQSYYAYASYPYDCYYYLDFLVKNTGNVNRSESTAELKNQDLHELHFQYMIQPHVSYEGARQSLAVWESINDDWVEYYGENYLDYIGAGTPVNPTGDPTADSLRVFIVWDGNNNKITSNDDTGDPDLNTGHLDPSPGMGRILSPQYFGMGFLHADFSVDDETNDLSQPSSTVWRPGDNRFSSPEDAYNFFFGGKHLKSPLEMGYTEPNDPVHVARPNPYICIGPYEMPFESDLHFVILTCVNGINYDMCNSVGLSWWTHWKGGNGMTDEEKNWWVGTGRDSLFKYFSQATRRYFRNIENGRSPYDIPEAPPAPDLTVTSSEKSVILEWSDVSQIPDDDTGVLDFAGYRIYRVQGRNDTTFQMIWECGGNSGVPVTTNFTDTDVQRGFAYFYYVTAYDDGSQNWEQPGRSLESGKYWNMLLKDCPVHPFMSSKPVPDLNNIKVVPNPYNDKSTKYNWPGEENKLLFINIPLKCTIKIYTISGDLVKTVEHDDGTTEQAWNQITDSNQLIYSGVYLYHVASDVGNALGKFVVVRSSREED
ncbi:T9SS type A sorting domain-containing protein [candidate division KSB1 bacterium]|nr:T9SS type A sorting domain-containing protein [candidate division KSB1 bacterium]